MLMLAGEQSTLMTGSSMEFQGGRLMTGSGVVLQKKMGAEEDVLASLISDKVCGNPCLAEVFADGREIRDLKDSAGDVVHGEVIVDLLEVGVHVDANLGHEELLGCRLCQPRRGS